MEKLDYESQDCLAQLNERDRVVARCLLRVRDYIEAEIRESQLTFWQRLKRWFQWG